MFKNWLNFGQIMSHDSFFLIICMATTQILHNVTDHLNLCTATHFILSDYILKGQLQRFYKLVSYERAVKILKNDICITEIGQAVLEIFEFKVEFCEKNSEN